MTRGHGGNSLHCLCEESGLLVSELFVSNDFNLSLLISDLYNDLPVHSQCLSQRRKELAIVEIQPAYLK